MQLAKLYKLTEQGINIIKLVYPQVKESELERRKTEKYGEVCYVRGTDNKWYSPIEAYMVSHHQSPGNKEEFKSAIKEIAQTFGLDNGGKEKKDSEKDIDVNEVANAIKEGGDFKDNLASIDSSIGLSRVLNIADTSIIEDAAFYTNSSSSAEEIIVIKATSADMVKVVTAAFDVRISNQKVACQDYLPGELPKLENAVKYTNGKYAILVISNDSAKAREIIDGYFK